MTNNIQPQAYLRERNSKCGLSLSIVYRRVDELKPDPANPRRHTKKQIRKIADSIRAFGFNVPVLIDRENNVVAGHAGCWPVASSAGPRCRRSASITSPRRRPEPSEFRTIA